MRGLTLALREAKGRTLNCNSRKAFLWEPKVIKSGMSLVGTLIWYQEPSSVEGVEDLTKESLFKFPSFSTI